MSITCTLSPYWIAQNQAPGRHLMDICGRNEFLIDLAVTSGFSNRAGAGSPSNLARSSEWCIMFKK